MRICLKTMTKVAVLRKDKCVWKFMVIPNEGDVEETPYMGKRINRRVNHSDRRRKSLLCEFSWDRYSAGYHCHTSKKAAKAHSRLCVSVAGIGGKSIMTPVILDYIIPAGTKVTYGIDWAGTTIVTPILINPRIKEK